MSTTLKQQVYERIRGDLLSGRWGPGERVPELAVARELGISRAPVREAMRQLAGESLVDLVPGMGAYVKRPETRELRWLYDLREAIETHAAGRAARRISPAQLELLHACNRTQEAILKTFKRDRQREFTPTQSVEMLTTETRFHTTILRASGNPRLLRLVNDLDLLGQLWSRKLDSKIFNLLDEHLQALSCHQRITAALSDGNAIEARKQMRFHVRTTMRRFLLQMQAAADVSPGSRLRPEAPARRKSPRSKSPNIPARKPGKARRTSPAR